MRSESLRRWFRFAPCLKIGRWKLGEASSAEGLGSKHRASAVRRLRSTGSKTAVTPLRLRKSLSWQELASGGVILLSSLD
jgi:hypothetical protein